MVEKVPENYIDVNRDKIWSNESVSTPQFAVPSNGGRAMDNRTMNSQFSILKTIASRTIREGGTSYQYLLPKYFFNSFSEHGSLVSQSKGVCLYSTTTYVPYNICHQNFRAPRKLPLIRHTTKSHFTMTWFRLCGDEYTPKWYIWIPRNQDGPKRDTVLQCWTGHLSNAVVIVLHYVV